MATTVSLSVRQHDIGWGAQGWTAYCKRNANLKETLCEHRSDLESDARKGIWWNLDSEFGLPIYSANAGCKKGRHADNRRVPRTLQVVKQVAKRNIQRPK